MKARIHFCLYLKHNSPNIYWGKKCFKGKSSSQCKLISIVNSFTQTEEVHVSDRTSFLFLSFPILVYKVNSINVSVLSIIPFAKCVS